MSTTEVHVTEAGVYLRLALVDGSGSAVDVSATNVKIIRLVTPQGQSYDYPAAFVTDGTDGLIQYQTTAGQIVQVGIYRIQGHVTWADGRDLWSTIAEFYASPILEAP